MRDWLAGFVMARFATRYLFEKSGLARSVVERFPGWRAGMAWVKSTCQFIVAEPWSSRFGKMRA